MSGAIVIMLDPFSIAAGTAGVVSFGLQVCGGLITFCRAWRSYDRDIGEALEKLIELELTLQNMAVILSVMESLDDTSTDNLQIARNKIYSCRADLTKLHSTLIKCESINQPASLLDKAHNARLRSMCFFNKDKLKGLRRSVAEIHTKFGSAI